MVKGQLLIVRAEIEGFMLCFVNVYAQNKGPERVCFFTMLKNEMISYHQDQLIIGGDFNCTLDFTMDRMGGSLTHSHLTALTVSSHT